MYLKWDDEFIHVEYFPLVFPIFSTERDAVKYRCKNIIAKIILAILAGYLFNTEGGSVEKTLTCAFLYREASKYWYCEDCNSNSNKEKKSKMVEHEMSHWTENLFLLLGFTSLFYGKHFLVISSRSWDETAEICQNSCSPISQTGSMENHYH